MEKQRKPGEQGASWALIILLFILGLGPIALILLIIKLFGQDKQLPPPKTAGTEAKSIKAKKAVRKAMQTPPPRRSNAKWLKIAGAVVLGYGLFSAWGAVQNFLWMGFFPGQQLMRDFLTRSLPLLVAGGALMGSGCSMSRTLHRFRQYLAVMGDREAVSLQELSRAVGRSVRRVEKDLRQMMERNYFGGRAYIHQELGYLLRGEHAEEHLRAHLAEAEMQAKAPQAEQQNGAPAETEEGYSGILREIRRVNDEIADPVLSPKIDRLEMIAGKIFRIVEEEPEKARRIPSFFSYYLPTTQKLLDTYAKFDRAGVEGENLRQAKARIETTMDAIVQGFAHQLDPLYREDALDVDQDIRVMEYMLRRDMATAAQDFGLTLDAEEKRD